MTDGPKTANLMEIPVRNVPDWLDETNMWMLSEPYYVDGVEVHFVASLRNGRMQDLAAATRHGDIMNDVDIADMWLMIATDGLGANGRPESHTVEEQFARIGYTATR